MIVKYEATIKLTVAENIEDGDLISNPKETFDDVVITTLEDEFAGTVNVTIESNIFVDGKEHIDE